MGCTLVWRPEEDVAVEEEEQEGEDKEKTEEKDEEGSDDSVCEEAANDQEEELETEAESSSQSSTSEDLDGESLASSDEEASSGGAAPGSAVVAVPSAPSTEIAAASQKATEVPLKANSTLINLTTFVYVCSPKWIGRVVGNCTICFFQLPWYTKSQVCLTRTSGMRSLAFAQTGRSSRPYFV